MQKININSAKQYLKKIQELIAQGPSPFARMSKDEAIEKMREIREKLWEAKLASRS